MTHNGVWRLKNYPPPSPPPPPKRLTIKKITGDGWEGLCKGLGKGFQGLGKGFECAGLDPRAAPGACPLGPPKIHKMITDFFALGFFIKCFIKGMFFVILKGGVLSWVLHPPSPQKMLTIKKITGDGWKGLCKGLGKGFKGAGLDPRKETISLIVSPKIFV